jgi:phosphatidylcholine synthase
MKPTRPQQALAWTAHAFTALGLVAAAGIAVALVEGGPANFRLAFVLMFVATIVDAVDGTWARFVRVRDVLPGFDGRRLDDLIDFLTYTFLPLLLVWRAGLVPPGQEAWLLAPLVASAYGFCQVHAKTDDGYFLGFPSYWNIVALYLYVLEPPGWVSLALLLFFALMTFVPARYLYPTHRGRLNLWTNVFGAVWAVLLLGILLRLPAERIDGRNVDDMTWTLAAVSLAFPVYYLAASWAISVRIVARARRRRAGDVSPPVQSPGDSRPPLA